MTTEVCDSVREVANRMLRNLCVSDRQPYGNVLDQATRRGGIVDALEALNWLGDRGLIKTIFSKTGEVFLAATTEGQIEMQGYEGATYLPTKDLWFPPKVSYSQRIKQGVQQLIKRIKAY